MIESIRALIAAHRPEDEREAAYLAEMLALLAGPEDPTARSSFRPGHFTASAFVTSPDGAQVLLVHHGKLHRWLQPGGHLEPEDADVLAAVRREVSEEVGLTELDLPDGPVLHDVDVHEIPPLKADPPHRHYDLRVHLRSRSWAFEAGSDARAARWVPLAEVDPRESDESVARAVRKLRRR